jgi:hypothetical protein
MIINADSERLMNAADMHIWGSAGQLPTAKYVDYFAAYAANPSLQFVPLPDEHASAIARFEQQNGQRLAEAYAVLVPDMQAEDRTGKAGDAFLQRWRAVRDYRMSLQKDIQSLRQQAVESPGEPLTLPTYSPFEWEDTPSH